MSKIKLFGVALMAVMFFASCGGSETKDEKINAQEASDYESEAVEAESEAVEAESESVEAESESVEAETESVEVKEETATSKEDWDAVLESYDTYIDQYIILMKKAANGDASAMTEYASMMGKATDLSNKMSKAGNDLSASQMAKFMKLQTKLASAAAKM
jgi:hypothetical protein